jgi:hypothetical protein
MPLLSWLAWPLGGYIHDSPQSRRARREYDNSLSSFAFLLLCFFAVSDQIINRKERGGRKGETQRVLLFSLRF